MKDFFFEISPFHWNKPGNPAIYASTVLPMDALLEELKSRGDYSDKDILTFITYSLSRVIKKFPRINSYFFFHKRVVRDNIRFSYMIKSDNPDSSLFVHPITFEENMPIGKLREKLYKEVFKIRKDPLQEIRFSAKVLRWTPKILRKPFFRIYYFLSKQCFLPILHKICPHDLFGSVIISYVGSIGLPSAFIPLLNFSTNSTVLAVGEVEKKLEFDKNKNVVEKKYLQLSWTVDHRHTHGVELAAIYKEIKKYFDDPKLFFT